MRTTLRGGWAMAAGLLATVALARDPLPDPLQLMIRADITIAPDGALRELQWTERTPEALEIARSVEPAIRRFRFEPGRIDGVPMETETSLWLALELAEGEGTAREVRIHNAGTGPSLQQRAAIPYPLEAMRSGHQAELVGEVAIDAEGRASVGEIAYTGTSDHPRVRKQFVDAMTAALSAGRYRNERVGGHPVEGRLSAPVTFCLQGRAPPPPWCDGSWRQRALPAGQSVPATETMPLHSVVRIIAIGDEAPDI